MFVKFEYEPIIEDFYSNGEMKIETILKILENSGNKHSDIAGNNILEGSSSGSAWILTDWYEKLILIQNTVIKFMQLLGVKVLFPCLVLQGILNFIAMTNFA